MLLKNKSSTAYLPWDPWIYLLKVCYFVSNKAIEFLKFVAMLFETDFSLFSFLQAEITAVVDKLCAYLGSYKAEVIWRYISFPFNCCQLPKYLVATRLFEIVHMDDDYDGWSLGNIRNGTWYVFCRFSVAYFLSYKWFHENFWPLKQPK